MRPFAAPLALLLALHSLAAADFTQLWADLTAKRKALISYHQEFDRTMSFTFQDHVQSSERSTILDGSGTRWREHTVSGSGDRMYLFDGSGFFQLEAGEYTAKKLACDNGVPEPDPYCQASVDLKKGVEVERLSCGLSGVDHECIVLDFPVRPKPGNGNSGDAPKVTGGKRRMIVDSTTGLVLLSQTIEDYEGRNESYRVQIGIKSKRMSWNGAVDQAVFHIPSGYAEVKELSKWDAERMKKELTGKLAPELALLDMGGKPIKLSELRGKTVLLEFWATWCGPCRADGPSLDKLYRKYGSKSLWIIGVSVDEEHATVQKFLNEHPHAYPI
ncbi:MAG: TlpA disulfide reductase family protein, partial [Bryobacteraceae bacterium]